ncbi:MAG: PKD domain-containing protein [bacterium]
MTNFHRKIWGVFFTVSLFFLLCSRIWADTITAGPFSYFGTPYFATFAGTLTIDGQGSQAGDIIGVFDNSVGAYDGCIGAAEITQDIAGSYRVDTYGDDNPNDTEKNGATAGDTLTFKLWRPSTNTLYILGPVNGNSTWPGQDINTVLNLISTGVEPGDAPVARFTASAASGCAPLTVQFTDSSLNNPTGWSWNFGDGSSASQEQSPSHVFSQVGTYTVSLTVTSAAGTSTPYTQTIQALALPDANFSVNTTSGHGPLEVSFTDLSTNNPTSWEWNFGDGTATSSIRNPVHTYSRSGTYTVSLKVTNGCGEDTMTKADAVTVTAPASSLRAAFTVAAGVLLEGCSPLEVSLVDQSTGDPVSWEWNFGDGEISTSRNPAHTFTRSGYYDITLKVKNAEGDEHSRTERKWIHVFSKPLADFRADKNVVCAGETVKFTNLSTGEPTMLRWNFGDNWISSKENPEHTYEKPGIYMVRLIATNMCGYSMEQKTSFIQVRAPEVDFDTRQTGNCSQLTMQFTAKSTQGSVSNCRWTFGGAGAGGTSNQPNPTYVYPSPGTYTVTLTADTPCGQATKEKQVVVSGTPVAKFAPSLNPGTVNQSIKFTDSSTGGPTEWQWDFGDPDQGTSTQKSPTYKFKTAGEYRVTLTVKNNCGSATTTRNIIIVNAGDNVNPIFTADSTACADAPVSFVTAAPSGVTINEWQWDFGDGLAGTGSNPTHTYPSSGTYEVTLTASAASKSYSLVKSIEVHDPPAISADVTSGCAPLTVQFHDNSSPDDTSTAWHWSFGDGNQSTVHDPVHTYAQEGNYVVRLTNECGEAVPVTIEVKKPLKADFTISQTSGPAPLVVNFQDKSTGATDLTWDFGDGETGQSPDGSHIYNRPGSYKIRLIAGNSECESEKSLRVDVYTLNSIQGKVLNSATNAPISGARIRILGENQDYWSTPSGDYTISSLRPGLYALLVSASGYEETLIQQIRVRMGKDTTQNLALNRSLGTIHGHVTGPSGSGPVAGAKVVAVTLDGGLLPYIQQATTNSEGEYTLYLGREGNYKLMVSGEGYLPRVETNQGAGYEITDNANQQVDIVLERRSWQPKVTISSRETLGTQNDKRMEIYIYADQNVSSISIDSDDQAGSFSAPEPVTDPGNRPCYKVIYSGYSGENIDKLVAQITFNRRGQGVATLPCAFTIQPNGLPGQGKCLKSTSQLITPAAGGRISGLGWIDLNGDGEEDLCDNSFVDIPPGFISESQGAPGSASSLIASLERRSDPVWSSLFALYRLNLMDETGNRIESEDIAIKEDNPLVVHLQFDPTTFGGSLGDLVINYQDQTGSWKSGLKNVHLIGNTLVFTATDLTSFALLSGNSAPSHLLANQDISIPTRLNLMWDDNADYELAYEVWRCVDESDPRSDIRYALLTTINPDATQYTDATCQLDRMYAYKIRAITDLGATDYSDYASMRVVECGSVPVTPANLQVQSVSKDQVTLVWTDMSSCESAFAIYRRDGDTGEYRIINTRPENSYIDRAVKPGCKYFYKVTARSNLGDSGPSNEVVITTARKSKKSSGMCFISSISSSWSAFVQWITGK